MKKRDFFLAGWIGFLSLIVPVHAQTTPANAYEPSVQTLSEPQTYPQDGWVDFQLESRLDTLSGMWLEKDQMPQPLNPIDGIPVQRQGIDLSFDFRFAGQDISRFGITADGLIFLGTETDFAPYYNYTPCFDANVKNIVQAMPMADSYGWPAATVVLGKPDTRIAYHMDEDGLIVKYENLYVVLGTDTLKWTYAVSLLPDNSIEIDGIDIQKPIAETTAGYLSCGIKDVQSYLYFSSWNGDVNSQQCSGLKVDAQYPDANYLFAFGYPKPCQAPSSVDAELNVSQLLPQSISFQINLNSDADGMVAFISTDEDVSARPEDQKHYKAASYGLKGDSIGGNPVLISGLSTYPVSYTGLESGKTYYVYVYAYNDICEGGPVYSVQPEVITFVAPMAPPTVEVESGDNDLTLIFPEDASDEYLVGVSSKGHGFTSYIMPANMDRTFAVGDLIYSRAADPLAGLDSIHIQVAHVGKVEQGRWTIDGLSSGSPYFFYVWKKMPDGKYTSQYTEVSARTQDYVPVLFSFERERLSTFNEACLPAGWTSTVEDGMNIDFGVSQNSPSGGGMRSVPEPELSQADSWKALSALVVNSDLGSSDCKGNVITPSFVATHDALDVISYIQLSISGEMGGNTLLQFEMADSLEVEYKMVDATAWIKAGKVSDGDELVYGADGYARLKTRLNDIKEGEMYHVRYIIHGVPSGGMFSSKMFSIKSVLVEPGLDCHYPEDIVVNQELTTHRSIALDWNDVNKPAASVIYRYRLEGEDDWSDYFTAQRDNGLTSPQLGSESRYEFMLQSVCYSGDSSLVKVVDASSLRTLPYGESFVNLAARPEGYKGFYAVLPESGSMQYTGPEDTYGGFITTRPDGENTVLGINMAVSDYWLTFPVLSLETLPGDVKFSLHGKSFYHDMVSGENQQVSDDLQAYVVVFASEDDEYGKDDIVDTLWVKDLAMDYDFIDVLLPDRTGKLYLALMMVNPDPYSDWDKMNNTYFCIDSIQVDYEGDVPCLPVENVRQFDLDTESIHITWDGYSYQYAVIYTNQTTSKTDTALTFDTELTLDGLEPGTLYTYGVQSFCEENLQSPGVISEEFFFTTLDICDTPAGFQIVSVSWNSVTVTAESSTQKMVHVWAKDQEKYPDANYYYNGWATNSDTVTVPGLDEYTNIDYLIAIRNVCAVGDSSQWTQALEFTTEKPECGTPTQLRSVVDKTDVTLNWTSGKNNSQYRLTYYPAQSQDEEEIMTYDTTYLLENLEKQTLYVWKVQGVCEQMEPSQEATSEFSTEGVAIELSAISGIDVFRTGDFISVVNRSGSKIQRLELLSLNGSVIYSRHLGVDGNLLIPVPDMASSVVLVRVVTPSQIYTVKVFVGY